MQIKSKIKISIISLFIISLLIGGVVMFIRLIDNKQVLDSDLYAYLPSDVSGILQIKKEKDLNNTLTYLDDLSPVIMNIKSSISYPLIVVRDEKCNYLVAKVTSQQEGAIKDVLDNSVFASFPPKKREYKGATLFFYVSSESQFFICTFYEGIFIGGFNIGLFQKYIDNKEGNKPGIVSSPLAKDMLYKIDTQHQSSLFLNYNRIYSVFNVNFKTNEIEMDGYDTHTQNRDWICGEGADTLMVDYSIFPDSLIAYKIEMDNPLISDTLKCQFSAPSYSFYIKEEMNPVYGLKHIKDKFYIYNMLNSIEKNYIDRRFDTNDFYGNYRIYKTSQQMGEKIFQAKGLVYLTFYKDHMIFSQDRGSLTYYLSHNGKYRSEKRFHTNQTETPLSKIIYSSDLKTWHPDFFNPDNPISQNSKESVYITSSFKDNKGIHKVSIAN